MSRHDDDLWVFAYGSLMWRPGFEHAERCRAELSGHRRSLCVYSVHWRGTQQRPGLVLGLDRGGSCQGVLYRVPAAAAAGVRAYLRERELIYGVYREAYLPVTPHGQATGRVMALAYVAERCHPSYAGRLPAARKASIVRSASGVGGTNIDYVTNALRQLAQLAIAEPSLLRLAAMASAFSLSEAGLGESRPRSVALVRAWQSRTGERPVAGAADRHRFAFRCRREDVDSP